jgi:hypothetical protein
VTKAVMPGRHKRGPMEMLITMSKAQKRSNREAMKPKLIKKSEQPAVSSSLIKTAIVSSEQPRKKH